MRSDKLLCVFEMQRVLTCLFSGGGAICRFLGRLPKASCNPCAEFEAASSGFKDSSTQLNFWILKRQHMRFLEMGHCRRQAVLC